MKYKIYADFQNVDDFRRIRLLQSSHEDASLHGVTLTDGMQIEVTDTHSLSADGTVHFSESENVWVVEIDWSNLRYLDE